MRGGHAGRDRAAGRGGGVTPVVVLGHLIGRIDPQMPIETREMLVGLIVWAGTQGAMMLAGYLARPAADDRPVVDRAATPPVGIPPA